MEASSFASRRPAATSLPAFSLPPPDMSSVNTASSQSSQPGSAAPGTYYPHTSGAWHVPGSSSSSSSSSYSYANNAVHQHHHSGSSLGHQPSYPSSSRSLYTAASPSSHQFGLPGRPTSSPGTADGLPATTYPESSSLLNPAPATTSAAQHHHHLPSTTLGPHSSVPSQGATSSAGPSAASENGYRPSASYYSSSSTAPSQSYANFVTTTGPQSSLCAPSPITPSSAARSSSMPGPPSTISGMAPPMGYGGGGHRHQPPQPYPGYPMQSGNPVLSNMHHPGAPLAMVGGANSIAMAPGYGPGLGSHGHHHTMGVYGHGQPVQQQDRPFKCDRCPQSFNRNHDLKRHKRIHLAVKPFPCTFCEKSFSRKDALKRHRLVKGCGNKQSPSDGAISVIGVNGASPPTKSDPMSDDTDGSPRMSRKERSLRD